MKPTKKKKTARPRVKSKPKGPNDGCAQCAAALKAYPGIDLPPHTGPVGPERFPR